MQQHERGTRPTDEELAVRARDGDAGAFVTLVETYQGKVYGLALRLVRDPDEAADITQDTLVRCYASLSSFDERRSFAAWIYRIAYNLALDALRRRSRRRIALPVRRGDDEEVDPVDRACDPGPSVEEQVEQHLTAERVSSAIEHLSPDHRHILVLKYTLDLSYGEMAGVLELPESTITMRLHHARRALRRRLESEDQ